MVSLSSFAGLPCKLQRVQKTIASRIHIHNRGDFHVPTVHAKASSIDKCGAASHLAQFLDLNKGFLSLKECRFRNVEQRDHSRDKSFRTPEFADDYEERTEQPGEAAFRRECIWEGDGR